VSSQAQTPRQYYVHNYAKIRGYFLRRTGSPDTADELVQEVWVQIASRAEDESLDSVEAWMRTVLVNLALKWVRKHRFRSIPQDPGAGFIDISDERPDAERILQARQRLAYLRDLVEQLPPKRRAVFVLYRGRGLSLKETADQLGISVKTVKIQMGEAMDFLRKRMSEAGLWP
jgi:RNA polymerase sigma factor (sigma-70 family)